MTNIVPVSQESNRLSNLNLDTRDKMDMAQLLSKADLLPKEYQGNPGNCFLAVLYGEAVGVNAAMAIWGVHIINNRPSPSASMVAGLVRGAGHILRVTGDSMQATATLIRRDDPGYKHQVTWTIEQAKKAQIASNQMWAKYPAQMLKRRAITEVCRDACPEILLGLHTPDELGYMEDPQGNVILRDGNPVPIGEGLITVDEPEPPAKPAGRQYSISTTKDVPKTPPQGAKPPEKRPEPEPEQPAQPQQETPVRVPDASLQGFFDPDVIEGQPVEVEDDPQPLRNEIVTIGKSIWGDKATARLKEFCGGSLRTATAAQCREWLQRLQTLQNPPDDETAELEH